MELPQQINYLTNKIQNIEEEQFSINLDKKTETDLCLSKKVSFEEFLGEDDESTEISSLLAELDASFSRSSLESESAELLNILKAPSNNVFKPFRTLQPRRISLNGKVLAKNFELIEKMTPERMSNPMFKNYNREM